MLACFLFLRNFWRIKQGCINEHRFWWRYLKYISDIHAVIVSGKVKRIIELFNWIAEINLVIELINWIPENSRNGMCQYSENYIRACRCLQPIPCPVFPSCWLICGYTLIKVALLLKESEGMAQGPAIHEKWLPLLSHVVFWKAYLLSSLAWGSFHVKLPLDFVFSFFELSVWFMVQVWLSSTLISLLCIIPNVTALWIQLLHGKKLICVPYV